MFRALFVGGPPTLISFILDRLISVTFAPKGLSLATALSAVESTTTTNKPSIILSGSVPLPVIQPFLLLVVDTVWNLCIWMIILWEWAERKSVPIVKSK